MNEETNEVPDKLRYTTSSYIGDFGRASINIHCPYCKSTIRAFVWSLAGKGKRCDCGAMHTSFGYTLKPKKDKVYFKDKN